MKYDKLFSKPCIVSIVGDVNTGKSMLLYNILRDLKANHSFNLFTYGLRSKIEWATEIYSIAELETIRDSVIVLDEFVDFLNVDERKNKQRIERTLRLINHNNNILILSGLPENYKKFLSAKIDLFFFKKCGINDCINGSRVKKVINSYNGVEKGTEILNIPVDSVLFFNGIHFSVLHVDYLKDFDSKALNKPIFEKVVKNVNEKKIKLGKKVKSE